MAVRIMAESVVLCLLIRFVIVPVRGVVLVRFAAMLVKVTVFVAFHNPRVHFPFVSVVTAVVESVTRSVVVLSRSVGAVSACT